jgi:ethanolamine ammonia-lyase small subunit
VSQGDLQIEFVFLARIAVGRAGKEAEALPELRHRLGHRTPRDGLLPRLEPVADRLLD